jgi:hypothetical protein
MTTEQVKKDKPLCLPGLYVKQRPIIFTCCTVSCKFESRQRGQEILLVLSTFS